MGKQLEGFSPRPGLISEVRGNCAGSRENRQGCVKRVLMLKNRIKTKTPAGDVSKVREIIIAGEPVVSISQTSGLARPQFDEN